MKDSKEFVPAWAKKVVWYQIFPERFRNSCKSNNPTAESLKGAWPHDITSPWQIHPWNSDWYKLQPYEKKNGKDFWFNVYRRRYGGDLQGIIDKFGYIQELGVSGIYLNPVFASPSSHKYDAYLYHHIDPYLGPDPVGDWEIINNEIFDKPSSWKWTSADKLMLSLIKELHNRGIRIIFDGVFNHIGINNFAFQDVMKNQRKSKYKNWFKIISWNDNKSKTVFNYKSWEGFKEMPEWNQDENSITEEPKKYIFDITKRWMEPYNDGNPENGIDGWRLDVAFCIKHNFWKDWRRHVKSINPNAYLTAEVIGSIGELIPYLNGNEFDGVMNYNFAFTCAEYFINKKYRILTSEFDTKLKKLRNAFPRGVSYVQQNLFDSHDTNRIVSHIVNKDLSNYRDWANYFFISKGNNSNYKKRKPFKSEIKILKLMVIFQMTYVGAPMIFYGDEVGMWGANDPCCRKPMIWEDIKYESEKFLPEQIIREKLDKVEFNREIFNHYKKLISIRNKYKALQIGSYKTLLTDDRKELLVFMRKKEKQKIIVALNNSDVLRKVILTRNGNGFYLDVLNEKKIKINQNKLMLFVPAKWGRILVEL